MLRAFIFYPEERIPATLVLILFVPVILFFEWSTIQQGIYITRMALANHQEIIVFTTNSNSWGYGSEDTVYFVTPDNDWKIRLPYQTTSGSGIEFAIISPDGSQLMVVTGSGIDLVTLNTGSSYEAVKHNKMTESSPVWSPDSQQIAFEVLGHIYIYDLVTNESKQITTGIMPIWSVDGTHILFLQNLNVYAVSFPDLTINQLTQTSISRTYKNWKPMAWSPDRTQLAFISDTEDNYEAIYILNVADSKIMQLTDHTTANEAFQTRLIWSPDGETILFPCRERYSRYASDLCLVNADGAEQTSLTETPTIFEYPTTWSPDRSRILFTASNTGEQGINLYFLTLDNLQSQLLSGDDLSSTSEIVTWWSAIQ